MNRLNQPQKDLLTKLAVSGLLFASVFTPGAVATILLMGAAGLASTQLNTCRGAKWYTAGIIIWAVGELAPNGIMLAAGTILCLIGFGIEIYDNSRGGGNGPDKGDPQLTKEGERKVRRDREERTPRQQPARENA